MPYLGILGQEFRKNLLLYLNSAICLIAKFCDKTKMPRFGTKNAWFNILQEFCEKLLSYLQSAISNLYSCKI